MAREGCTDLPRYRVVAPSVTAAPIVDVDPVLGQVTVRLPDGSVEMRHGSVAMFADGTPAPQPGDVLVVHDDGRREACSPTAFVLAYVPVECPPTPVVIPGMLSCHQGEVLRQKWAEFECATSPLARVERLFHA